MDKRIIYGIRIIQIIFLILALWGFLVLIWPRDFLLTEPSISLELFDLIKGLGLFIGGALMSIFLEIVVARKI